MAIFILSATCRQLSKMPREATRAQDGELCTCVNLVRSPAKLAQHARRLCCIGRLLEDVAVHLHHLRRKEPRAGASRRVTPNSATKRSKNVQICINLACAADGPP